MNITNKNGLKISSTLFDFINTEVIPGTNIDSDSFWNRFSKVVHELAPISKPNTKKKIFKKLMTGTNQIKVKINKKIFKFLKSISY